MLGNEFKLKLAKAGFIYSALFALLGVVMLFLVPGYAVAGAIALLFALAFTFAAVPSLIAQQLQVQKLPKSSSRD